MWLPLFSQSSEKSNLQFVCATLCRLLQCTRRPILPGREEGHCRPATCRALTGEQLPDHTCTHTALPGGRQRFLLFAGPLHREQSCNPAAACSSWQTKLTECSQLPRSDAWELLHLRHRRSFRDPRDPETTQSHLYFALLCHLSTFQTGTSLSGADF